MEEKIKQRVKKNRESAQRSHQKNAAATSDLKNRVTELTGELAARDETFKGMQAKATREQEDRATEHTRELAGVLQTIKDMQAEHTRELAAKDQTIAAKDQTIADMREVVRDNCTKGKSAKDVHYDMSVLSGVDDAVGARGSSQ